MNLTPHFQLKEFGLLAADHALTAKLRALAELLEAVRRTCGDKPIVISRGGGYRSGDSRQHGKAEAADFVVRGLSCVDVARLISAAVKRGEFPAFGQLIIYPFERFHAHLSMPTLGPRNGGFLVCVKKSPEKYVRWTPGTPLPPNENHQEE